VDASSDPSTLYRFYWPGSCLEAIERTDDFYRRARPDTNRFDASQDTMLTSSAQVARDCVRRFTTAQVKPAHLITLARVHLATGDDSAASAAILRRIAHDATKPTGVRANTLAEIIRAYLQATPIRLSPALATLRQLEALSGPDAAVGKVAAYQAFAMHYARTDDDSNTVAMSEALIAAGKQLSPHDRHEFARSLLRGYALLADIAGARTGTPDAPSAILTRARSDIGSLNPVEEPLAGLTDTYRLYARPAGRLSGDFWFLGVGAHSDTASQTNMVRPTQGKIAIVSFQPARGNLPAFRRLQHRFGDRLELTFVLRTNGYFRDQGPLQPADEAAVLRRYYVDELRLPGALVISAANAKSLPDGRLVKEKTENVLMYGGGGKGNPGTIVVDRNGTIRRIFSGWTPWTERELEQTIEKLLGP
jgi:hypothetical protein